MADNSIAETSQPPRQKIAFAKVVIWVINKTSATMNNVLVKIMVKPNVSAALEVAYDENKKSFSIIRLETYSVLFIGTNYSMCHEDFKELLENCVIFGYRGDRRIARDRIVFSFDGFSPSLCNAAYHPFLPDSKIKQ